ncbi:NADH-quinone oxidoreductase subunit NuoK [Megalodesulfovibrio gigas]|uniref:NADH-quinone oxidoreductase subunit K n=1 Tax=Megalodesulfovibrio gigas (strain ATCC 19364 / DSM 1382 / NCIMB 9332 / VKM B-1759) TaxID=1121448 RepID=T2G6I1_MEGG1|nr:NADH-quinone oxidoreductase subunit K [Megalodesulfovibrio gigas]AGW12180.1 putative NADH-quinone oxidoreductase chain 4L [Megalodesulfovibrio gigas DSM 1382 = ATCC 19364]
MSALFANPLLCYQLAAVTLLALGLVGFCLRRTLVGMLISVELMLNGAGLSIVAATQLSPAATEQASQAGLGQLGALLVMGLAAAEATLVLAIVLVLAKRFGTASVEAVSELKG